MKSDSIEISVSPELNGIAWEGIFQEVEYKLGGGLLFLRGQELEFTTGGTGELKSPA